MVGRVRLESLTYVVRTRYGNSVRLESLTYVLRRPSHEGVRSFLCTLASLREASAVDGRSHLSPDRLATAH